MTIFPIRKYSVGKVEHVLTFNGAAAATVVEVEMVMSSDEEAQPADDTVQRRTALLFAANPVTPDVGLDGVVIVAAPLNSVQVPVPELGVFPARVAVVPATN